MHTLFDGSCNYTYQIIYSPSLSFKKNRYFYKLSKDYKNAKKEYTVFKDVLQEKKSLLILLLNRKYPFLMNE